MEALTTIKKKILTIVVFQHQKLNKKTRHTKNAAFGSVAVKTGALV